MSKLPSVVSSIPPDLKAFVNQVREALDGRGADKLVTVDDLVRGGVVVQGPNNTVTSPAGGGVVGTPATPKNVQASGAIQNIIVTWDNPLYNGHAYTEVWSSSTNDLGDAVQVGMTPGAIFVDSVGPSVTRYYWVRFVNVLGVKGAFNAVSGVQGVTGSDVAYLLDTLTDAALDPASDYSKFAVRADFFYVMPSPDFSQEATPTATAVGDIWYQPSTELVRTWTGSTWGPFVQTLPFVVNSSPQTINGVAVPAGVYMDAAFIKNGTITNAKIGNAAIDDAKIANLNAGKITAGFISADRIQAGSISAAKLDTSYLTVSASSVFLQDGEAAADINANTTTINGGKITTNTLTVDKISSGTTSFGAGGSFSLDVAGISLNGFTAIEAVKVGANKWGIISFQEAPGSDQCAAIAGSTLSSNAFSVAGFAAFSTAYNSFYTSSALANNLYGYSGRYNRSIGTPNNQSLTSVNSTLMNGSDNAGYFVYYGNTASARVTEVYLANTSTVSAYVGRRYDTSGTTLINEMFLNNGSYSAQSTTGAIYSAGGYLPFTGTHDGLIEETETPIVGDIVVDYQVEAVLDPSNIVMLYKKSSVANQKGVIGVCIQIFDVPPSDWNEYETTGAVDPITGNPVPNPTPIPNPMYYPIPAGQKVIHVNALGEGTINVCGEGGDIELGDLIVTSSTPGKGMKQTDDLVRSYTVAKAREAVSFSSASEVKRIACIYMAG